MAITDLTNTTWLFNDSPSVSGGIEDNGFNINFTSNSTNYNRIRLGQDGPEGMAILYFIIDSNIQADYAYEQNDGGWADNNYKTINITGGTDATNSSLIAILTTNATQILDPPISQFQNCQLCLKQPLGAYTLTWDSGITVTVSGDSVSQGYELQDGDIILATVDSSLGTVYAVINAITYNAPADISLDDTNIHISYYLQGSGGSVN